MEVVRVLEALCFMLPVGGDIDGIKLVSKHVRVQAQRVRRCRLLLSKAKASGCGGVWVRGGAPSVGTV